MDRLFEGQRNLQDDFYYVLGCSETSSTEQILTEYKQRALQYHPDKNPNDTSMQAKFLKLQEAKETLINPTKRRDYDVWRNSGITILYQKWVSMRGQSTPVFHWITKAKNEGRMLEYGRSSPSDDLQESTKQPCSRSNRYDCSRDSIISKFRNYEI